jgi:hypothetical protein
MKRLTSGAGLAAGALLMSGLALGQEPAARTVTTEEAAKIQHEAGAPTEVQSPMLIEMPVLAARFTGKNAETRLASWFTSQSARYVCDQAQVKSVRLEREEAKRGKVKVTLSASLSSGWPRQDVDLTLALLRADGSEVMKRTWDDLTIGNGNSWVPMASETKRPSVESEMSAEDFAALFADGKVPSIRVLVAIQE